MHNYEKEGEKMDAVTKRKLKQVIRGFIGDGFSGTQEELAQKIKERGFKVTQSTISRTLSQMGVVKEITAGQQIYKLKNDLRNAYRGSLSDLVLSVSHNNSIIVIKTRPGSAMFVAGFLDHEYEESLLGTIAGDDTIFAAPHKKHKINEIAKTIEKALKS